MRTFYRIQGYWHTGSAPVPEGLHHEGGPVMGQLLHQLRVVLVPGPGPHQCLDFVHADGDVGVADHADQLINIPENCKNVFKILLISLIFIVCLRARE